MTEAERLLVRASAALAAGDREALAAALLAAAEPAGAHAVEEMLLQSYLFLGYPRALQALAQWRDLTGLPAPPGHSDDDELWEERGERVCAHVYAGQYQRLRSNVARLHPDVERWMVHEGYGKVLGRPGLALRTRELCILALLALQDAPAQLHSHLRGALHVGVAPEEVTEALASICAFADDDRARAVHALWDEVQTRWSKRND